MSIFFFFFLMFLIHLSLSFAATTTTTKTTSYRTIDVDPFTPKASLIRYWNTHISNHLPKPVFFLSKASPLSAIDFAFFAQLATRNTLSSSSSSFCSLADLFCLSNSLLDSTINTPRTNNSNFTQYGNRNFANYGTTRRGGTDSFKNYSDDLNSATHSFIRYSKDSTSHHEDFTNYAEDSNVANSNFLNYAAAANGSASEFINYDRLVNVPDLKFTSYDSNSNAHKLSFSAYNDEGNSGTQAFTSYGKKGHGVPNEFNSYADSSNIITSTFTGYGEVGNKANDTFKAYGVSANNPHSNFKSYGNGGNSGTESFSSYRNQANVGDDTFLSYGKSSKSEKVNFVNYGRSYNHGNDTFKEYSKGSGRNSTTIEFKSYSVDRTFTEYNKKGVVFAQYNNLSTSHGTASGITGSKWVEPGKFFRELMLKEGNVMVMPDIRDRMPKRSFLPRPILEKLPFSTLKLAELSNIFRVQDQSNMDRMMLNAIEECERAPSLGETKRCVGSGEDMIDFATAVLGRDVVVRTSENVKGSKQDVMIGLVKGINGGKVTKSVSCHQSLYPYLLYYCHSVPKVRVYEADIHDVESKAKINRGVAICHVDTSAWGPEHGAFVALGSGPGQIEVCHWIFENDMTWAIADH